MAASFRTRRLIVRMQRWLKRKSAKFEDNRLSIEQDKSIKIVKKLIADGNSQLYASLSHERYLIENGNIFIRMTSAKIRIIDGNYKYDVSFDTGDLTDIKRLFTKSLEHKQDRLEQTINMRVEKSLDHILNDLTNE